MYDAHTDAILKNLCLLQLNGICLHVSEMVKIMFQYKTGLLPDICRKNFSTQESGIITRNASSFHKCKPTKDFVCVSTKVLCFFNTTYSLLFYVAVNFLFQSIFCFSFILGYGNVF